MTAEQQQQQQAAKEQGLEVDMEWNGTSSECECELFYDVVSWELSASVTSWLTDWLTDWLID